MTKMKFVITFILEVVMAYNIVCYLWLLINIFISLFWETYYFNIQYCIDSWQIKWHLSYINNITKIVRLTEYLTILWCTTQESYMYTTHSYCYIWCSLSCLIFFWLDVTLYPPYWLYQDVLATLSWINDYQTVKDRALFTWILN